MLGMTDIPDDPKKIRARIRRYERKLQQEKTEFGCYSDGAGKRYLLGPLYLLMGDLQGAIESFWWFSSRNSRTTAATLGIDCAGHLRSIERISTTKRLRSFDGQCLGTVTCSPGFLRTTRRI